jgi:hypothetical protein
MKLKQKNKKLSDTIDQQQSVIQGIQGLLQKSLIPQAQSRFVTRAIGLLHVSAATGPGTLRQLAYCMFQQLAW